MKTDKAMASMEEQIRSTLDHLRREYSYNDTIQCYQESLKYLYIANGVGTFL